MFILFPLSFLYFVFISTATHITHTLVYLFARYVSNRTFYKQVLHQNEKEKWEGTAALQ